MYKPTAAIITGKRLCGNDWEISLRSHTGKAFTLEITWESGADWHIGEYVFCNGDFCVRSNKERVLSRYKEVTGEDVEI